MSNPSPEPSAESRKTATEMHNRECPCLSDAVPIEPEPDCVRLIWELALALDAAKRSSRREALGQAADLAKAHAAKFHTSEPMHSLNIVHKSAEAAALDLETALRALMEAE